MRSTNLLMTVMIFSVIVIKLNCYKLGNFIDKKVKELIRFSLPL